MNPILTIAIILVAILLIYLYSQKPTEQKIGGNLSDFNDKKKEEFEKAKDKVLDLFKEKSEVTNNDVEKFLNVSDATATRYLEALEQEGKIVQIGKEGRGVVYKLNL